MARKDKGHANETESPDGEAQAAAAANELAADETAGAGETAPATAAIPGAGEGGGAAAAASPVPIATMATADLVDAAAGDDAGETEAAKWPPRALIDCERAWWAASGLAGNGEVPILEDDAEALADFFRANPDAPAEAGAIHVRRTLGRELLPGAEPRRLKLALTLFKLALLGHDAIVQADADVAAAEAKAAEAAANRRPVDPEKLAYRPVKGRAELSSLGKAAKARG